MNNWIESQVLPSSPGEDVCPHCRRRVVQYSQTITANRQTIIHYHCAEHGFVPPMRSAVVNDYSTPDWSAA